jgi:GH15 family glucan-1,4-alpha-glucosidase
MSSLELGLIGNCSINALVDDHARIVWSCFPRFDGDPVFCRLLDNDRDRGYFGIELENMTRSEQRYWPNTAILETILVNTNDEGVMIIDFAPRFEQFGRMFRPTMLVRIIRPIGEAPQIRIRARPLFDYGRHEPKKTRGSNHIRFVHDAQTLRLTTSAPITYVLDETLFQLDTETVLVLGPDESFTSPLSEMTREFLERTDHYWRSLSGRLHLPLEWQDAVIRSAITLKLCSFEETGAIIAAPTTSLPEMDGHGRNWDYRFCWLRDAFFVVRTLNRLGYIQTMESYLDYLANIVLAADDGYLQPVFGIGLEKRLIEKQIESLEGYRGNKPVRRGNQAYEHDQHDGYGSVILASAQAFFDQRLWQKAGRTQFERLEILGHKAFEYHNVPDAGLWEFRTRARVHTHSSMMCWAACDRLSKIAEYLGFQVKAEFWRERAGTIRELIMERAWNEELQSFTVAFDSDELDASLLIMAEIGMIEPMDPHFLATVDAIGRTLKQGDFVTRYKSEDDFGKPTNTFLVCSFWYVEALSAVGREEEARAMFEKLLECRNGLGLLSEDVTPETLELWGNFPQAYSHVGLISCAMRLSRDWSTLV